MFETLEREAEELLQSDLDPVAFAIEAIRINLAAACYKHETILLRALEKLQKHTE